MPRVATWPGHAVADVVRLVMSPERSMTSSKHRCPRSVAVVAVGRAAGADVVRRENGGVGYSQ